MPRTCPQNLAPTAPARAGGHGADRRPWGRLQERVPGGQAKQWWYPTAHPDVHEAFSYIACSLVCLTQLDREDRRSTQ